MSDVELSGEEAVALASCDVPAYLAVSAVLESGGWTPRTLRSLTGRTGHIAEHCALIRSGPVLWLLPKLPADGSVSDG